MASDTIRFNREEGIKRVTANLQYYHTVTFVETSQSFPKRIAAYNGERLMITDPDVEWFNRDFKNEVERLAQKRPRKGRGQRL